MPKRCPECRKKRRLEKMPEALEVRYALSALPPHLREGDENEPQFENGRARLVAPTRAAWQAIADAGFLSAHWEQAEGGLQLPEYAVFSGDTVRRDAEGFLYFIGRRDEMIKTSGYRVSPVEIEEVIYGDARIAEVAAFGIELTVELTTPGSYFMACGWSGGYFGLQELRDGKKGAIFSVWDPTKGDDPKAVRPEDRVELLHEGAAVRVRRFGGEGTGVGFFYAGELGFFVECEQGCLLRDLLSGLYL